MIVPLAERAENDFESLRKALGTSPEETLTLLIDLGMKAVSLTTRGQPKVLLFSADRQKQTGIEFRRG